MSQKDSVHSTNNTTNNNKLLLNTAVVPLNDTKKGSPIPIVESVSEGIALAETYSKLNGSRFSR